MRRSIVLGGLCIFFFFFTSAQTSVSRTYIKGGKDAWANYLQEVYFAPAFEKGMVEYKNGQRFKSTLNYNKVLGAIQFIDEKGDTLALNNDENSVASVTIGTTKFFMDPVCMQEIAGSEKAMLAKNERAKQTDQQKVGALGIPSSTATIDSYDRSYSRNNHFIDINEELLIRKTTTYYVAAGEGKFVLASKRNIMSKFPKSQKQINEFIREKAIDFDDEADLVALIEYLQTL